MDNAKVYVEVLVNFEQRRSYDAQWNLSGKMGTKYLMWYRILARERCASRKAGGTGIMLYRNGEMEKRCHLYYEFDKWFMERRCS